MTAAAYRRRRARGEDGVSLAIALVFIIVLGALIVSLLALTGVNFQSTLATRSRTDALYSADGGADFALEQIRATATSACPPSITAPPASNGITPTVSVACTGGSSTTSSVLGTYSAIALGSSGIQVGGSTQNGDNLTIKFVGDVYSGGGIDGVQGSGNNLVVQGNAAVAQSSCPYRAGSDPSVSGTCTAKAAVPAVAQTSPKVVIPTNAAPNPVTSGSCTLIYPGVYTGSLPFSSNAGYYLASGTYYINSTGDLNLTGWIQGGAPGSTTPALSSGFTSRCPANFANDTNAKVLNSTYNYTGSGVTLVLGGNAVLRFADSNSTRVELFPRMPGAGSPDLAATPGVSIWGQTSSSGATGAYNVMTQYQSYYSVGSVADVVTQGLTWLPNSLMTISPFSNSDGGGGGQLSGGVVADSLLMYCNNLSGGVTGTVAGTTVATAAPRVVTITSTARPFGVATTTTVKVVATFPTTAGGYPTINSWRKV